MRIRFDQKSPAKHSAIIRGARATHVTLPLREGRKMQSIFRGGVMVRASPLPEICCANFDPPSRGGWSTPSEFHCVCAHGGRPSRTWTKNSLRILCGGALRLKPDRISRKSSRTRHLKIGHTRCRSTASICTKSYISSRYAFKVITRILLLTILRVWSRKFDKVTNRP